MKTNLDEIVQEQIEKLSEAMIDRRMKLDYSQTELSEITGLTQPQTADVEKLKRMVKLDTLLKHITALNLEIQLVPKKFI
jgi:transcriptional regulator with XRE-family HTH domain